MLIGLAVLAPPARAGELGSVVVIHVLDANGQPLASAPLAARCPEGPTWRVTADAEGYAVIADVPSCPLSVEAEPGNPGLRFEAHRQDGRVVGLLPQELLRDAPSSGNPWSPLETAEPAAILDRIDGAGLYLGEPGRFSLRGASWSQNAVLLDGVDLTDPLHGGTPITYTELHALERIELVSGLAPVEQREPGVALALAPRRPAHAWQATVGLEAATEGLQGGDSPGEPPSIARLGSLVGTSAVVSGPLGERLRLLASGRFARVRRFERDDPLALEARLFSFGGHLVYQPGEGDTLSALVSGQGLSRPFAGRPLFFGEAPEESADALGAQLRFTRAREGATVSTFAGFHSGTFEPRTEGHEAGRPVERLLDGPPGELVFPSRSQRRTWSLGASLALRARPLGGLWHAPRAGLTLARASSRDRAGSDLAVPERVAGLPSRVWEYSWAGPDSSRHVRDLSAWAADRLVWKDRLLVEAGFRLDASAGTAEGAAQDVSWTAVSPRASARLRLTDAGRLTAFGGYAEYVHRLLLAPLAFGDPNAQQAIVYRWEDPDRDGRFDPAERGVLVARVGPGAPDGTLTSIDPALRPPRTRELVVGLELRPGRDWLVRLTGFDRRERDLLESVDVGVPASGYTVRYLPDPAGDLLGPQDDQQLPVYDRKPETFGLDRYVLTNPAGHEGRHRGLELRVEKALGARLLLLAGATASMTETAGANRGFRVLENDQGLVGELFDDPNADTHAGGRGFFDRSYTIKVAAGYRLPRDWRLGLAARYQDGQPFARVVVVEDLAQGPEAISATPRGQITGEGVLDEEGRYVVPSGHRFKYTLTVDARIEKGLTFGPGRLALVAEAFNLLGLRNEVEEDPVSGPPFRTPTAVQPPRVLRLGLRLDF
jgi:hypothetical protein